MLSTTFVIYFHVVFTLPHLLNALIRQNPVELYNLLFRSVAETLMEVAANPKHLGAEIGFFAILHTWGQNLLFHPHIHCVVPSGGLAPGRTHWIRGSATFFLPLQVLQQVFRGKFIDGLEQAFAQNRLNFSGLIQHLAEAKGFAEFVRKLHRRSGSSIPSLPLVVRSRFSAISAATLIVWPSPITD